jgi:hypothetical protein
VKITEVPEGVKFTLKGLNKKGAALEDGKVRYLKGKEVFQALNHQKC